MKKSLFLALIFLVGSVSGQSLLSKLYCQFLGSSDVKQEYKELAHKALKDFGISNPETVSVKQMNSVGSLIALMPLSSFTAFGIWLDEKYLDSCSQEEKVFHIYHEAAHYARNHHQKLLGIGVGLSAAVGAGLLYLNKKLHAHNIPYSGALTLGSTIVAAAALYLGIVPTIVKRQEKQADVEAAKKLSSLGNQDIVNAHIAMLRQSPSQDKSALWWFSENEQAHYLEQAIQ